MFPLFIISLSRRLNEVNPTHLIVSFPSPSVTSAFTLIRLIFLPSGLLINVSAITLIILGIFFALAVLKHRPYLQNFWKMAVITILLLVPILIVNLVIGGEANYWYLMNTPEGESLMDLMPAPPYHMLGVAPLALVVFFITYLPFLIWDKTKKV